MVSNSPLLAGQSFFLPLMNHSISVSSYNARDQFGNRGIDGTTTRQYKCYIQNNENTRWATSGATDALPYVAYVLSTPIGQSEAVPIRVEEQITVIQPSYLASDTPRRMGTIKSYFDDYGNLFCYAITFE